jgi:7-cyano-7-deazaguanine reductase
VPATESRTYHIADFAGDCIDDLDVEIDDGSVDANLLQIDVEDSIEESLHSHLLRSNCPVTNQPDMGSVLIRYRGPKIDRASLLEYIVSYRQHNDFHEACVERMFVDIKARCNPEKLTVYARYNRRGGLDINPFRSDFETSAENLRLWRQ